MPSGPITSWQIEGEKVEAGTDFLFLSSRITAGGDCSHEIRRQLLLGRNAMTNLVGALKSKDITLPTKSLCQSYDFFSSHVQMWELDHREDWAPRNWCFWIVVLERILVSPLDSRETKPANPKGNQPWILIARTDAETQALVLWPPDANSQLIRKEPDAGKDWRQMEKRAAEDEMARLHHWLSEHEL